MSIEKSAFGIAEYEYAHTADVVFLPAANRTARITSSLNPESLREPEKTKPFGSGWLGVSTEAHVQPDKIVFLHRWHRVKS